jgi:hypothetical protein
MKYTVVWIPDAEQELAAIWMAAPDRNAVTAAAHIIDTLLREDPETRGESREHDRRVLLEAPLGVLFKVLPDDRLVRVLGVWHFGKHSTQP